MSVILVELKFESEYFFFLFRFIVQEFRSISLQLVQSHYRSASEQGVVNRIEVLPISWHTTLHSEDTGIDKKLKAITLESIPKLRHFTNDTLLDILFYTSPVYCQTIMHAVGNEINRLFALFKDRNPNFDGDVYLGGHSLGSLILFDLLCHQKPTEKPVQEEEIDPYAEKSNVCILKIMFIIEKMQIIVKQLVIHFFLFIRTKIA